KHAPHDVHRLAAVDGVHLPVGSEQRLFRRLRGHYASLRTATPGRSLPSRYSRVAPPPVETCEYLPARPSASTAAAVSPPPTRVYAPDAAMAPPTAFVPALNSGTSVMPSGPFQTMVPAPSTCLANRLMLCGPMSTAIQPASTFVAGKTRSGCPDIVC